MVFPHKFIPRTKFRTGELAGIGNRVSIALYRRRPQRGYNENEEPAATPRLPSTMGISDEQPCNTIVRRHRISGHRRLRAFSYESSPAPTRRLDSPAFG